MTDATAKDLDELVRERAYFLWEQSGRPHGREHEFWAAASQEIEADQIASAERQRSERSVAR